MKLFPKLAFATALSGVLVGAGASLWGAPTDAPTTEAGAIRAAILDDFRAAEHAQAVARKAQDIIKLNCVNDKLVQMKPDMNVADKALAQLQASSDPTEQHTALVGIRATADRIHKLRGAAEECAGNKNLATESANTYTHPDITLDPNADPVGGTVEPPVYASPFS